MKDLLPVISALLVLITPDPDKKNFRLEKAERRDALKNIRIANRMYKQVRKEYKKDGFTEEELATLKELKDKINARRIELI